MTEEPSLPVEIDPLLVSIAERGWSEELAVQFERKYGEEISRIIVVQMARLGVIQSRVSPERLHRLPSPQPDLFYNVKSDLNVQLLGGLVGQYVERVRGGKVHRQFLPYLSGVIHNLVIADARELGLLGNESPAEIVRSICEAKGDRTRLTKIAWAKFCLEHKVRFDLVQRCSRDRFDAVYRRTHRVADYFFERFIPDHCADVLRKKRDVLNELIGRFLDDGSCVDAAVKYIGTVTPYARWSPSSTGDDGSASEYESEFQRFLEEEGL